MMRVLALLLVALAGAPALSEVLVTVDGDRIETQGPWEVKGRRIQFTDVHGTLRSLSRSAVDLEASEAASAPAPEPAPPAAPAAAAPVSVSPALLARANRTESSRVLDVQSGRGSSGFASAEQIERLMKQLSEDELATVAFDILNLTVRMVEVDQQVDLLSRSGIRAGARRMASWVPEVQGMRQRATSDAAREIYRLTADDLRKLADLAESNPDAAIGEMRESVLELRREFR